MEKTDSTLPRGKGMPHVHDSKRWPAVLLGLIIFLCGAVMGGGATLIVTRNVVLHRLHNPEERILQDTRILQKKLGLTDEQTQKVLAVFTRHLKVFYSIRRQIHPKVQEQLESLKVDVASILDSDQARKWNTWFEKTREMWTPPLPPPPEDGTEGTQEEGRPPGEPNSPRR